jgi:hypothetical protein
VHGYIAGCVFNAMAYLAMAWELQALGSAQLREIFERAISNSYPLPSTNCHLAFSL